MGARHRRRGSLTVLYCVALVAVCYITLHLKVRSLKVESHQRAVERAPAFNTKTYYVTPTPLRSLSEPSPKPRLSEPEVTAAKKSKPVKTRRERLAEPQGTATSRKSSIHWESLPKVSDLFLLSNSPVSRDGSLIVALLIVASLGPNDRLRIVRVNSSESPGEEDPRYSMFQAKYNDQFRGYSFKNLMTGTYLSRTLDGVVTLDKIQSKSFEHWTIHRHKAAQHVALRAATAEEDLLVHKNSGVTLKLRADHARDAVQFDVVDARTLARGQHPTRSADSDGHAGLRLVVATTSKPMQKATAVEQERFLFVLSHWVTMVDTPSQLHVVICWEDESALEAAVKLIHEKISTKTEQQRIAAAVTHTSDCEFTSDFKRSPTYRGLFNTALEHAKELFKYDATRNDVFLMYANADIVFAPGELVRTLSIIRRVAAKVPLKGSHIFVTGRRRNCDPTLNGSSLDLPSSRWFRTAALDCELFGEDAQDYFIVDPMLFDWMRSVPPLVVGGIAFDNFFTSQANKLPNATCYDATATLSSFHLNHGSGRYDSHHDPKSLYNSKLAHESGGWARGKVTLTSFATLDTVDGEAIVYERHVVMCSDDRFKANRCSVVHWNQQSHANDPPDAFSRPWKRPD